MTALAGSALAGSALAGSDLAGPDLAGSELAGSALGDAHDAAASSSSSGTNPSVHHLEQVMGTVVVIDAYLDVETPPQVWVQVARARAALQRADAMFSLWRPHSPMSRVRRGELSVDDAPPVLGEVLGLCEIAKQVSGGWFDPWALPGGVDPTGYVKGWAAQQALAELCAPEIVGSVVNAAGDIAMCGHPHGATSWRIGITDPRDTHTLAAVLEVSGGAVATSGTYERGRHLVDPWTKAATSRCASATVCGPDLGLADALATAVAVAGPDLLDLVEEIDGYEALLITDDGRRLATSSLPIAL